MIPWTRCGRPSAQVARTAPAAASTLQRHPPTHGYHTTSARDLKCHLSECTSAEPDPGGDAPGLTVPLTHHQENTAPTLAEMREHSGHQLEEGQDQGEEKRAGNGNAKQLRARPGLSPPYDLLRAYPPRGAAVGTAAHATASAARAKGAAAGATAGAAASAPAGATASTAAGATASATTAAGAAAQQQQAQQQAHSLKYSALCSLSWCTGVAFLGTDQRWVVLEIPH